MKKEIIINQFFGIGDILFIEPIMRDYFQQGHKVTVPILYKYLDIKRNIPYVNFVDKNFYNIDYEEQKIIETDNHIILPMRWSREFFESHLNDTMKNKYRMVGIELEEWRKLIWLRHRWRENSLKELLGIKQGEKFNLINCNFYSFENRTINLNINNKLKNIEMKFIPTFNLLDWACIIEEAENIYSVNTSIIFLLEVLNLKAKEIHLYSRNVNGADFIQTEYLRSKNYILYG